MLIAQDDDVRHSQKNDNAIENIGGKFDVNLDVKMCAKTPRP